MIPGSSGITDARLRNRENLKHLAEYDKYLENEPRPRFRIVDQISPRKTDRHLNDKKDFKTVLREVMNGQAHQIAQGVQQGIST